MTDDRDDAPAGGEAPEPGAGPAADAGSPAAASQAGGGAGVAARWWRWVGGLRERLGRRGAGGLTPTRVVTAVLLALLGFTFTVQVRSVSEDPTVAALGQEDLVRILANLDAHEERLRRDIAELQETRDRLSNADQSRQEALAEADRRADELGVLAGTLPVVGPGLVVEFHGGAEAVGAARMLDAVQELRSAGAEAMQVSGAGGSRVRVVASTYFLDGQAGGIVVDGRSLQAPYTLTVVGDPQTLAPALRIPGGVVESAERDGGTVAVHEEPGGVEVSAVREPAALEHARPVS